MYRFSKWRIALFTIFALIAFASNSVLNRLALGNNTIDAGSFVGIRIAAGAFSLWLLNGFSKQSFDVKWRGHFRPALYLLLYGVAFSFAYRSLSSGTGAFILFGTVQATMLSMGFIKGERPSWTEWLGLLLAISGLVYLLLPGLSAPEPAGATLMVVAGVAWAFYSLSGKGVADPLQATASNFAAALPMVLVVNLFTFSASHLSLKGTLYACLSGSITSGVGYAVWYAALKGLTNTQAALLQLSVPVLAAVGGILFLSEHITNRLLWSGLLIIGGVTFALFSKNANK